jgi:hypothetical protein
MLKEVGPMKKSGLFILIFGFLVFSLAGVSYGWQGRMGGMGDPYGLVEDESDFLIHPAGIANGKGINFYGGYRFNWVDVTGWNYTSNFFDSSGLENFYHFKGSGGNEFNHDALLGAAFPLGPGRMGLFFQYSGKRADFDGHEYDFETTVFNKYTLQSDLDDFVLRLLYGFPMGGFKLGGEIQLAYRHEKNDTFSSEVTPDGEIRLFKNLFEGPGELERNLLLFMFPYNTSYWEALLKGSIEGVIGPARIAFTVKGGVIFGGDNKWNSREFLAEEQNLIKLDGDVHGWKIGGDLYLRYPLSEGLSLPFLMKVGYEKKRRDGKGFENGVDTLVYKHNEEAFQIEVGGGLDKELVKGTRIAAGIYYGYLKNKNDFVVKQSFGWEGTNGYPDHRENQLILRLAGEREICPAITVRMGLDFFYGWVKEDSKYLEFASILDKNSLDGHRKGIGGSLGGTVKFQRFSIEPFLRGGFQTLKLGGHGINTDETALNDINKSRKEWLVGGGLSIKY